MKLSDGTSLALHTQGTIGLEDVLRLPMALDTFTPPQLTAAIGPEDVLRLPMALDTFTPPQLTVSDDEGFTGGFGAKR
ncbi:hypothetical protein ACOMHN_060189 [Nucella lapillus]